MIGVDVFGIDLGTTNSVIAHWRDDLDDVEVIENSEGCRLTPSLVSYEHGPASPLVGQAALEERLEHPEAVVYSVKRFIGRTFRDDAVARDSGRVTYDVEELAGKRLSIRTPTVRLTPPEVSAQVLRKLRDDAAAAVGCEVARAVVTVPAYFREPQREATQEAVEQADMELVRVVNEPTAAALGFGLGADPQMVAVYDLGGGTFDISLVQIKDGLFKVLATRGDANLGGDDFDAVIVGWLAEVYKVEHGVGPALADPFVRAYLGSVATRAKIAVSDAQEHELRLPPVRADDGTDRPLCVTLTQQELKSLTAPLIERTMGICSDALEVARRSAGEVDQVLLVGGQTRMPAIAESLKARFGWVVNTSVSPDEAVARGAAVLGARMCGLLKDRVTLWDVTPFAVGVELEDGAFEPIIEGNQQVPVKVWRRGAGAFTTHRDGQMRIKFRVFQGNATVADENVLVGEVVLDLPAARPRGEPRIECLFRIDDDGILHVRAEDADTGAAVEHTFERSYQVGAQELQRRRASRGGSATAIE